MDITTNDKMLLVLTDHTINGLTFKTDLCEGDLAFYMVNYLGGIKDFCRDPDNCDSDFSEIWTCTPETFAKWKKILAEYKKMYDFIAVLNKKHDKDEVKRCARESLSPINRLDGVDLVAVAHKTIKHLAEKYPV